VHRNCPPRSTILQLSTPYTGGIGIPPKWYILHWKCLDRWIGTAP